MALLHLLRGAESISSLRDRSLAAEMATRAIQHLINPSCFRWLRLGADGKSLQVVSHLPSSPNNTALSADPQQLNLQELYRQHPEVRDTVARRTPFNKPLDSGRFRICLPFFRIPERLDSLLFAECESPLQPEQQDGIFCFLHFYANYLTLLDYGELDTLTGLQNRRRFDEFIEKLITSEQRRISGDELRTPATGDPYWLAVLDIDRFKHINDTWGHLFGDETLLRFSRILKTNFRAEDHLFRFGGEEFIAIISAPDVTQAYNSLERFRIQLANSEFPQVGSITCSIGFTRLNPENSSADTLGCADQALYFGRNQTCCYEGLASSGRIAAYQPTEGTAGLDFDINALFL